MATTATRTHEQLHQRRTAPHHIFVYSHLCCAAGKLQLAAGDKVVLLKRDSCICPRVQVGSSYLLLLQQPKKFKDVEGNQV